MGVDYSAVSLIGLPIDKERLYIKTKVKAFEHDYDEKTRFDPETGKALWETVSEPINGFDEEDYPSTFHGFAIIDNPYDEEAHICIQYDETDDYRSGGDPIFRALDFKTIEKGKEKLKALLKPLKMWNEKEFGLYTLLRAS